MNNFLSVSDAQDLARFAGQFGASDVVLLDMQAAGLLWADYFLLMTFSSQMQKRGFLDELLNSLKTKNYTFQKPSVSSDSAEWTVFVLENLVFHFFTQTARDFYALEQLWDEARLIEWDEKRTNPPQALHQES